MDIFVGERCRIVGEFANDFFEQVFESDKTHHLAVLVDHQRDTAAVPLEVGQLHGEWRPLGYEIGFALTGDLAKARTIQRAARQFLRDAFHVQ